MSKVKEVSTERQNTLIRTIVIVVLMLLSLLATILYVYAYPKTYITMYDNTIILKEYSVKKHSTLGNISGYEKVGYTFTGWTYDYDGLYAIEPDRELVEDELDLYAQYDVNTYTVTFHVKVWNEDLQHWDYAQDVYGCDPIRVDYMAKFTLPTGRGIDGELLPEFEAVRGHKFLGWTTDSNAEVSSGVVDYWEPGETTTLGTPGNLDVYAYFGANKYAIQLHTGIEYYKLDGTAVDPSIDDENTELLRDSNNQFVIGNNRVSTTSPSIRYTNKISTAIAGITPSLIAEDTFNDEGASYNEYEFGGWFLDQEYTMSVEEYDMAVEVDDNDVPYFTMTGENGAEIKVYAELAEDETYKFNLYSKWTRKSYKLSFNKRMSGSSGAIASINVYKYDEIYGKYYNTSVFDENSRKTSGCYYTTLDLSNPYITSESFKSSLSGWRFTGWTLIADSDKVEKKDWYHAAVQETYEIDKLNKLATNSNEWSASSSYKYIQNTYRHEVSEDVTLYAQWSELKYLTLQYAKSGKSGSDKKIKISMIKDDQVILPSEIQDRFGWEKTYNAFAGWTVNPDSTSARSYAPGETFPMESKSTTLYVKWSPVEYTVNFYYNDGTDRVTTYSSKGGKTQLVPASPTREGYIFEGWTHTQYPENTPLSEISDVIYKRASGSKNTSVTVMDDTLDKNINKYYGVWTLDYLVRFDANVSNEVIDNGELQGKVPNDSLYSTNNTSQNLTMSLTLSKSNLTRTGYSFMGWAFAESGIVDPDNIDDSKVYKAGTTLIFNFKTSTYSVKDTELGGSFTLETLAGSSKPNMVKLYAVWKPQVITVTLRSSEVGKSIEIEVKYGESLDLSAYKDNDVFVYPGHVLEGWGDSAKNKLYDVDGAGAIISAENIGLGQGNSRKLLFYALYSERKINISYYVDLNDIYGSGADPQLLGDYPGGIYGYNSTFITPTPEPTGQSILGDTSYGFAGWYYRDGDNNKVYMQNGDLINYEVNGELKLFADFEKIRYTINFVINNPISKEEIETKTFVVDKNTTSSDATGGIYDEVVAWAKGIAERLNLKSYNLASLTYTHAGVPTNFVQNLTWNETTFIDIEASGRTLTFESVWESSNIVFAYTDGTNKIDSVHEGYTYSSTKSLKTLSSSEAVSLGVVIGAGTVIKQWILGSGESSVYIPTEVFLLGVKANGAYYSSISELDEFIVWEEVSDGAYGKVYKGVVTLTANTAQVYNIKFYRYNTTTKTDVLMDTKTVIYSALNPDVELLDARSVFTDMGLRLDGWTYGGTTYSLSDTFTLNPAVHTNSDIEFHAEYSIAIVFSGNWVAFGNAESTTIWLSVKGEASDYVDYTLDSGYVKEITIKKLPSCYVNSGEYNGMFIKVGDTYSEVNTQTLVPARTLSALFGGNAITIDVYASKSITITYRISEGEKFVGLDNTVKTTTVDYCILSNDQVVHVGENDVVTLGMKVEYSAEKELCTFEGWKVSGSSGQTLYKNCDLTFKQSTTLVSVFSEPEAGNIAVVIKYLYGEESSWAYEDTTARNGQSYTLLGKDQLSSHESVFNRKNYIITGWIYGEEEYKVGDRFDIPRIVAEGTVYEFTAIWEIRYTVTFDTVFGVTNAKQSVDIAMNEEYVIDYTPVLSKPVAGTEFKHWTLGYYTTDAIDGSQEFHAILDTDLNNGDSIKFGTSNNVISGISGMVYTVKAIDGLHDYVLRATWDLAKFTVAINIPANGGAEACNYTISDVSYGTVLSTEFILSKDPDAGHDHTPKNGTGISGWALSAGGSVADLSGGITENMTLYAVWSTSYTLKYASNEDIAYLQTLATEYYFEGDKVAFSANIIKSIYYKGNITVYLDNKWITIKSEGNDYYRVKGFKITNAQDDSVLHDFVGIGETFTVGTANMVATPVFERVYKVDFAQNYTKDSTALYEDLSTYVLSSGTLDVEKISVERENFTFNGWSTSREGSVIKTLNGATLSANVTLYASWTSNIKYKATFGFGGNDLFEIEYNAYNQITKNAIETELNKPHSGFSPVTLVAGNKNTYKVAENDYYYLQSFSYNSITYSLDELVELTYSGNSIITLQMTQVYTIEYSAGKPDGATGTNNWSVKEYITQPQGSYVKVTATGMSEPEAMNVIDLPNDTDCPNYAGFEKAGWKWTYGESSYTWNDQNKILSRSQVDNMISKSSNNTININIDWQGKAYAFKLAYVSDADGNAIDPYDMYAGFDTNGSNFSLASGWAYAYSSIYTRSGANMQPIAGDKDSGTVTIRLGATIAFNNISVTGRYILVGWSTTKVKLGLIPSADSYYQTSAAASLLVTTYEVDGKMVTGASSGVVTLYPVYKLNKKETVKISAINGSATYKIEASENLKGYVYDESLLAEQSITATNSKTVEISFTNKLTVSAGTSISSGYVFNSITYDEKTIRENSTTIGIDDLSDSYLTHEVNVNFDSLKLTVTVTLNYSHSLVESINNGKDTSAFTVGDDTLNADNMSTTFVADAAKGIVFGYNLSEYYKIDSVKNDAKSLSYEGGNISIIGISYSADKKANITIYLVPKTATIEFDTQGGTLSSNALSYTNNFFVDAGTSVEIKNNSAEVFVGSAVIMPSATMNKYTFSGWKYRNDTLATGEAFEANNSGKFTFRAAFTVSSYSVTYDVSGTKTTFEVGINSTIKVGYAENQTTLISTEVAGKTFVNWKVSSSDNQSGKTFNTGDSFTTGKCAYTFTAIFTGAEINVIYANSKDDSKKITKTAKFDENFTTITDKEDGVSDWLGETYYLYGWSTAKDGTGTILEAGTTHNLNKIYPTYIKDNTTVTLYSVYYNLYTYTITYDVNSDDCTTTIDNEIVKIKADANGNPISSQTFKIYENDLGGGSDDTFAGYTLTRGDVSDKNGDNPKIYRSGATFTFTRPASGYSETYTLKAEWDKHSQQRDFIVTIQNPEDNSKNLNMTFEGNTTAESYTISLRSKSGSFVIKNEILPTNVGNVWTSDLKSFTTDNEVAYANYILAGFEVRVNGTKKGVVSSSNTSVEVPIATDETTVFTLIGIWETKKVVKYFDINGQEITALGGSYRSGETHNVVAMRIKLIITLD